MATVLDSFVIELGLDPEKLDRGQRETMNKLRRFEEQATRSGKSIEAQQKKTSDLFAQTKKEVLGGLGLIMGFFGAKKFIDNITALDAMTGRFSKTIGMNVDDLAAWEGALKQVGGTTQDAISGLGGLAGALNHYLVTSSASGLEVFNNLHVALFDHNHQLRKAGQLWLDLSAAVQGMPKPRAAALLALVPGANQSLINLALLGPAAMKKSLEESRKVNDAMKPATEAAQEYQKSISLLDQAFMNLGRHLETWIMPALTSMLNAITEAVKGLDTSIFSYPSGKDRAKKDNKYWQDQESQWMDYGEGPPADVFAFWPDKLGSSKGSGSGVKGGNPLGNEWRFLKALSYLETNDRDVGNAHSSAKGYFQFLDGTAAKARRAGLRDPQHGNFAEQGEAAMEYIKRFYPKAAAAIDNADYTTAIALLPKEWSSLPGGSQPQSRARYKTFFGMLRHDAPAIAANVSNNSRSTVGGDSKTTNVTMGDVNIIAPAAHDAHGVASSVGPAVQRSISAAAANSGPQ